VWLMKPSRVKLIDLTCHFGDEEWCHALMATVTFYFDADHLKAEFSGHSTRVNQRWL